MFTEKMKSSTDFQEFSCLSRTTRTPKSPYEAALQSLNCALEDMARNNQELASQIRSWKIESSSPSDPIEKIDPLQRKRAP